MSYSSEDFQEWVKTQILDHYEEHAFEEGNISFQLQGYTARLVFYPEDIVELSLTNDSTGENCFYLHFQANEKEHAEELFRAMTDTLNDSLQSSKRRILIVCSSAMTSTYFSNLLNEASAMLKFNYEFDASDISGLYAAGADCEAILLTPQISYEYEKTRKVFKDKTVLKIPTRIYAGYNSGELLNFLNQSLAEKEKELKEKEYGVLPQMTENDFRILTIGMINNQRSKCLAYRIYDHGKKTLDKEVIKHDISMRDIEDLLAYVFARHRNIDCIVLGLPGVENDGKLTIEETAVSHADIVSRLKAKFHHEFFLLNDVNAIALGYSTIHPECSDLLFYFQPLGYWVPGAGLIENGKLRKGYHNASGEMRPLLKSSFDHLDQMINTPEGTLQIIVKGLMAYICTSAPKAIALYSEMVPEAENVRKELERNIPEEYIPPIRRARHIKEYLLAGLLSYGMQML